MATIKVFDTKVRAPHFDVMSRDEATALKLANQYVVARGLPADSDA